MTDTADLPLSARAAVFVHDLDDHAFGHRVIAVAVRALHSHAAQFLRRIDIDDPCRRAWPSTSSRNSSETISAMVKKCRIGPKLTPRSVQRRAIANRLLGGTESASGLNSATKSICLSMSVRAGMLSAGPVGNSRFARQAPVVAMLDLAEAETRIGAERPSKRFPCQPSARSTNADWVRLLIAVRNGH